MNRTIYMETTKIDPSATVADITRVLGLYGASSIRVDYENKEVTSVSFMIEVQGQEWPFRLPCRWNGIFDHLQRKRKTNRRKREGEDQLQAKRVAWRQILRWIEAQFALVDTGMVEVQEVFLPYIQTGINETLYDRVRDGGLKMLENKA